jgi:predicted phage terminase large subunit-like protein
VSIKLTPEVIEGFVKTLLWKSFDEPSPTPEFHRELWELCCSDHPLIAIGAPRGHAKSTAISFVYTLAAALFRQAKFILLVSDTEGQAMMFLDQIKTALQTNTDLINFFGIKDFPTDSKTDIIVRHDDGYCFRILAKGAEQKVRGLTWDLTRPDLIIGDDLENDEIVMNDDRREKFRLWMIKALLPCRAPKGKVRLVGTILHLDSFLARILPLEGDRDTQEDPSGLRFTSKNPKKMFKGVLFKAHIGSHPSEIKRNSHLLWPDHKTYSREWFLDKYEAAVEIGHPEGYSQEYLNRPLDEATAFFRRSDLQPMQKEEEDQIVSKELPLIFYAGADLAITESERADYSAFIVVGVDSKGFMYVMDVIRERMDGRKIVDTILGIQRNWNLQWFAIEKEKTSKSIMPFLREEMFKTGIFVNTVDIVPHTDKTARASSIQSRMRIGGVKFKKKADWYPALESEFLSFPRGKHDDQVDAFSCIGLALQKLTSAESHKELTERELQEQEELHLSYGNDGRSATTGY